MTSSPILVTGSAGAVGRSVCTALLAAGYAVRGFDRVPMPADWSSDLATVEHHQGELTDVAAVARAVEGCDRVIHLAGIPYPDVPLPGPLCEANVIGLHHVLEACRTQKVARVVLTSSVMVAWDLPWRERIVALEDGVKPVSDYALTKLLAEQMGEMYSRVHGMSIVAIRLGWHLRTEPDITRTENAPEFQAIYLSTTDAGKAFRLAIEADVARVGGFAVVYITSRRNRPTGFDLTAAKAVLGYEPDDIWPQHALPE